MKKIFLLIVFLISAFVTLSEVEGFTQGTWVQKANFPGIARCGAINFSIGTKGYIGGGNTGATIFLQDFWEWDQLTDTWTQKANFGSAGGRRYYPVCFTIANKGYVSTGYNPLDPNLFVNDMWVYDPAVNLWTQKTNMPGIVRMDATGFSIGYKGYVGGGDGGISPNFGSYSDFWEYNSLTDSWMQKANFPGIRVVASCFSIGNKGYMACGLDTSADHNDLWEWDQLTNTWTQKANLPAPARGVGVAFSVGSFGYYGTGCDWIYPVQTFTYYSDLWQYSPVTNSWLQMTDFAGGKRAEAAAFTIGCKAYLAIGIYPYNYPMPISYKDLWEFTPPSPSAAIAGINYICAGDTTSLFASGGLTYQWSTGETTGIIHVKPTATTTYSVTVSDGCGSSSTSMTVTVLTTPVADFSAKLNLCTYCAEFTDKSTNAVSWFWDFGDGDTSTVQDTNHCYGTIGNYSPILIVSSQYGTCRDTSNGNGFTFFDVDETQVIVPNIFSPNGDGVNDMFSIAGLDKCQSYSIRIYNRWGVLIFETAQPGFVWDGRTTTGMKAEAGVYYYTLTNNTTEKKGFVTLIR